MKRESDEAGENQRKKVKITKESARGDWTEKLMAEAFANQTIEEYEPPLKSEIWALGLRMLRYKNRGTTIPHWFRCSLCGIFFNCVLGGGNGKLRNHMFKHNRPVYTFTKSELADALNRANKLGDQYGLIDFNELIPAKW